VELRSWLDFGAWLLVLFSDALDTVAGSSICSVVYCQRTAVMLALVPKSPTTDVEFAAVFNRLLVALREPADDTGVTLGVYYDALKDLPLQAVEVAAVGLSKEAGRRFFPTTAEWHTAAEKALQQMVREAVKPARAEPWHHECGTCEDTGWVLGLECDGSSMCGRKNTHAAHSYTRACPCRATNKSYIRNQQFGQGTAT
jgi:hypothetical protein